MTLLDIALKLFLNDHWTENSRALRFSMCNNHFLHWQFLYNKVIFKQINKAMKNFTKVSIILFVLSKTRKTQENHYREKNQWKFYNINEAFKVVYQKLPKTYFNIMNLAILVSQGYLWIWSSEINIQCQGQTF